MKGYLIDNLYQKVIKDNAPSCNRLKVISGYASPEFTRNILLEYPILSIDLFIGMTPYGISEKHHNKFIELMNEFVGRISVYYQFSTPATHMKLYSWYFNDCQLKTFGGSANFTFNGFGVYNEILVEIGKIEDAIFSNQQRISILATDKYIYDRIIISKEPLDTDILMVENSDEIKSLEIEKKVISPTNVKIKDNSPTLFSKRKYSLTRNQNIVGYQKFVIPILSFDNNDTRAVNAWKRNQTPYLIESTNYQFSKYFPIGEEMTFYTDDGKVLKGIIKSERSNRLIFEPNIYEYLVERLGISEKRPILPADLQIANKYKINIVKINDLEYDLSL